MRRRTDMRIPSRQCGDGRASDTPAVAAPRIPTLAVAVAVAVLTALPARSHDGGFGHSQRTIAASADPRGWTIEYRVMMGADEAIVELAQHPEPEFYARRGEQLAKTLRVTNLADTKLVFVGHALGPALTQTYRYRIETPAQRLVLEDHCFPHKPGVVRCVGGTGVSVTLGEGIDWSHAERATVEFARDR